MAEVLDRISAIDHRQGRERLLQRAHRNKGLVMTLGEFLKEAREKTGMSLRDVEKRIDISNGYLSQLESNKIKRPSPVHLYGLATLYQCDYTELMRLAGYVVGDGAARGEHVGGVAFSSKYEELTDDDRRIVDQLVERLRRQNRSKGS